MKTNPIFRATYIQPKEDKKAGKKEKMIQIIFDKCHAAVPSKKKTFRKKG